MLQRVSWGGRRADRLSTKSVGEAVRRRDMEGVEKDEVIGEKGGRNRGKTQDKGIRKEEVWKFLEDDRGNEC